MDIISYQIGKNSAPQPSGSLSITENGTYDVTEKASAVVNVPSALLTYTATFEVDGVVVEKMTVNAGTQLSAPVSPTKSGSTFSKWKIKNGADVTFPYSIASDVELEAVWTTYRTVAERYEAGTLLVSGGTTKTKQNAGFSVFGFSNEGYAIPVLVSNVSADYVVLGGGCDRAGSITYNGETWYYQAAYFDATGETPVGEYVEAGTISGHWSEWDFDAVARLAVENYINNVAPTE